MVQVTTIRPKIEGAPDLIESPLVLLDPRVLLDPQGLLALAAGIPAILMIPIHLTILPPPGIRVTPGRVNSLNYRPPSYRHFPGRPRLTASAYRNGY